jgi:hypothetical protein
VKKDEVDEEVDEEVELNAGVGPVLVRSCINAHFVSFNGRFYMGNEVKWT